MSILNKILTVLLVVFICSSAYGWRMARPITLTHPLDDRQIRRLNDFLEDVWNLGNGRINMDVVTSRTSADSGDIWLIQTGIITYIQYKNNGHIYTITPDGF